MLKGREIGGRYQGRNVCEPLQQRNVWPLMTGLCDRGKTVLIETSGAHDISEN